MNAESRPPEGAASTSESNTANATVANGIALNPSQGDAADSTRCIPDGAGSTFAESPSVGGVTSEPDGGPYMRAALDYWRRGHHNPIPVGGKSQPPSGFTGAEGKTVGFQGVERFHADSSNADKNIALRLTPTLIGIDVDAYGGKTGDQTVRSAEAALGTLPPTYVSTSRGTGQPSGIRLYRLPADGSPREAQKRIREAFGPHVDVIWHGHRYAMVGPSVHPESGETYRWIGPDGKFCDEYPRAVDFADLPRRWVDFLTAATPVPAKVTAGQVVDPFEARSNPHKIGTPIPVGERDQKIYAYACLLRDKGHGREEIAALVALRWKDCDEPATFPLSQALAKVDQAMKYAPGRAGAAEVQPFEAEPYDDGAIGRQFPAQDWHQLWADDSPEEWIVEPILPARRLVALYSPPKVGKSLLLLEIAANVARGTDVLGVTPDRPRSVLYVDFENDPKGDIRPRLQAMGFGPDDLGNLHYLSFPTMAGLDSPVGGSQLMAAVEHYSAEVVVIDTVSRAVQGEENENDTWLGFYRNTGLALKQAGVAMIRLDHTGKDETRGQRGGSAKSGDVDAVWRLERKAESTFRLTCEANRMPVAEKEIVVTRMSDPHLRHKVEGAGWMAEADAVVAEIIAAADAAGLPQDAGRDRLRKAAQEAGIKAGNARFEEAARRRKTCPGQVVDPFGQEACPGQSGAAT